MSQVEFKMFNSLTNESEWIDLTSNMWWVNLMNRFDRLSVSVCIVIWWKDDEFHGNIQHPTS